MVKYSLLITAELDNIAKLEPQGGCDDPDFSYLFKLKCGACGEVTDKYSSVQLNRTVLLPTTKGTTTTTTHLLQKCKFCEREGTVTMVPGLGQPLTSFIIARGYAVSIMKFDCNGFEPLGFVFGDGWKAQSDAGTVFKDIDLSDEFHDYDEKGQVAVMISKPRASFKISKW
ncbi:hypothetical protein ACFE04_014144 [Oxalis oulophora]